MCAFLIDAIESALNHRRQPLMVMNHQQLLRHVNESGAEKLINVDAHSDICARSETTRLQCGTWISYVKWRKSGTYVWVRNDPDARAGNCNDAPDRPRSAWSQGSDWWKVSTVYEKKLPTPKLYQNEELVGVGIALSPGFSHRSCMAAAKAVRNAYPAVTYRKGTVRKG